MKKPFIFSAVTLMLAVVVLVGAVNVASAQTAVTTSTTGQFCYTWTTNLSVGSSGPDVNALGKALELQGFTIPDYAYSGIDGSLNYGDYVAAAVTGFQQKYASEILTPNGLSYGTGFVGPSTRAKLNQLYGCGTSGGGGSSGGRTSGGTGSSSSCYVFNTNLGIGSTGPDVVALQTWLIAKGFDIPEITKGAVSKGFIGRSTALAIQRYQSSVGIEVTGYLGPLTRASINVSCSGGTATTTPSITVLSPNGGEVLTAGQNYRVRWDSNKIDTNVFISWTRYFSNENNNNATGSSDWIGYNVPNTGYYDWKVNVTPYAIDRDNFKVSISGEAECPSSCNTYEDYSDGFFKIVSATTNQPPVISGLTAPTTLTVGQTGTWALKAYDPENGSLSYSIDWGDAPSGTVSISSTPVTQTSTFTHSYASAGTYTVKLTVTDSGGLSAYTSTTVVVSSPSILPTQPQAQISFVSQLIRSYYEVVNVASSTLVGSITLKMKAVGGSLKKPVVEDFNFVFTDGATNNPREIAIVPSQYGGHKVITVWPRDATVGDGGEYTIEVQGSIISSNPAVPVGSSAYQMMIKDIDYTIGGVTKLDQPVSGLKTDAGTITKTSSTVLHPSITVLSPNGGEVYVGNQPMSIKWTSTGGNKVAIYLTYPDGGRCHIDTVSSSNLDYKFTPYAGICSQIPLAVTDGKYKISINLHNSDQVDSYRDVGVAVDSSDNYFAIIPPATTIQPSISFTLPKEGGTLYADEQIGITWTAQNYGSTDTAYLLLLNSSGQVSAYLTSTPVNIKSGQIQSVNIPSNLQSGKYVLCLSKGGAVRGSTPTCEGKASVNVISLDEQAWIKWNNASIWDAVREYFNQGGR